MTMGTRRTAQQVIIRGVFENVARPLTAFEVHELACRERPNIGIATVYRAIRRMLDSGILQTVNIPGAGVFYELAPAAHHHYFHCEMCQRVYVIDGCPKAIKGMAPPGFAHEWHDLVLHGQCRNCLSGLQ